TSPLTPYTTLFRSAPPPASARRAHRPAHRTSRAPAAAPSAETSPRKHDAMAVPRCGASDPRRLPPHTASTAASPAGSSRASAAPHPPPATACCALAPALLLFPTLSCSSPSAPI